MKKHYPWLWFDADGTLFDFNRGAAVALEQTFQASQLPFKAEYLDVYQRINLQLWQALERGEIAPAVLGIRRFELLLAAVQLTYSAEQMSTVYLEQLARRAELIDGAYDVLHALHGTCRFAILTNGLQVVQRGRLAHSTIKGYIDELIISEEVGAAKPTAAFFETASTRLGHPAKRDVLMIGDSLSSDIRGGVDYGIDTCWYNPTAEPRPDDLPITYEIAHLHELLDLLD